MGQIIQFSVHVVAENTYINQGISRQPVNKSLNTMTILHPSTPRHSLVQYSLMCLR